MYLEHKHLDAQTEYGLMPSAKHGLTIKFSHYKRKQADINKSQLE